LKLVCSLFWLTRRALLQYAGKGDIGVDLLKEQVD